MPHARRLRFFLWVDYSSFPLQSRWNKAATRRSQWMPGEAAVNRKSSIGNSCGGDLHEGPSDTAFFGFAKKEAFLGGTIVIRLAERAATVGDESGVFKPALCEAMKMSTESGLQVMLFKHFEDIFSILRPHPDSFTQREMSEGDKRSGLADFFRCLGQELNRGLVNAGFVRAQSFGAVKRNELPAFVLEIVVEAIGENVVIAASVGLSQVIVISRHRIEGNAEAAENLFNRSEFLLVPMM